MVRVHKGLVGLGLAAALGAIPATAAQRAFVASYGSDANAATFCSLQAPCRSFEAAISVVDSGGEVLALDAAGYGSNITISKPLTLTANPGFHASILATSGTAVRITTGAKVILRGLDIRGAGADTGVFAGGNVDIEDCLISNFLVVGVDGWGKLRVSDTVIRNSHVGIDALASRTDIVRSQLLDNDQAGIEVDWFWGRFPAASSYADISVSDSLISNNHYGIRVSIVWAGGLYRVAVTRTTISHNFRGIDANGDGYVPRPGFETQPDVRITVGDSQITANEAGLVNWEIVKFESMGNNLFANDGLYGTIVVVPGT